VGTNKRYPHNGGRLAEERELREARTHGPLQTLTDDQLRLHARVVSIVPERPAMWGLAAREARALEALPERPAMWGLAWLRFGDADVRCTVRVKRWAEDAVGVDVDVEVLRCWVWQGAVNRLAAREDAWG